jgi:capsular exopolysaccharide synthesis family protein
LVGFITILFRDGRGIAANKSDHAPAIDIRELGAIPKASRPPKLRGGTAPFALGKTPSSALALSAWHTQSPMTESYFSAVTSIVFSPGFLQVHRILTVTSVSPQEGKTTIITNLATALAETSKKVLLIDADLRRPGLHRIFDCCNDAGLTSVMTGDVALPGLKLDRFVQPTPIINLFLVPCGPGTPSINQLLHSERVVQFLRRAREEYDFVLIDTPPMSLFSDARLLARISDSVILVYDGNKTKRDAMNTVVKQFATDGTNILGFIRNRCDLRHNHSDYSSYYHPYAKA